MMSLVPLGDQAALLYFSDEARALQFAAAIGDVREPWIIDVVPAYTSVAVFYDSMQIPWREVEQYLRRLEIPASKRSLEKTFRRHSIPCCYRMGLDLDRVSRLTGLKAEDVIAAHSSATYTVYAIGFCPGFPYLGYLPDSLCGVPRLESPRLRVEPGMVGLTGRQTGIYTEPRPGGWNLIGRTPLELVNVAEGYFPLRTGDTIQFCPIDEREFGRREGERLEVGNSITRER